MLRLETTVKQFVVFLLLLAVGFISSAHAASDARFALVIGNSAYQHASSLKNPSNDSKDIAAALRKLNFKTIFLQNATKQQIEQAVSKYISRLDAEGGVGLFYFAGHGVQFQGNNYLLPVDVTIGTEREIQERSFSLAGLLNKTREMSDVTNIVVLDACRNNPFSQYDLNKGRSANPGGNKIKMPELDTGLSKLDAPPNTLIAFATAPGHIARDGKGRNSPYTAKLIRSMMRSGLSINEVFRQVRQDVLQLTGGEQVPWETSSLIDDFYFKPRSSIPIGF